MMKVVYLAWQNPEDRNWVPVGRLSFENGVYRFVYTKGALRFANFIPFGRMTDLCAIYESEELFPLFANRLLSKSRPEYKDFLYWLNVKESEEDPLALLARTGGIRETDSLMVFPCPEKTEENTYHLHFFSQGIRYLPSEIILRINTLTPGHLLYLMPDPQNPNDLFAIALRTEDPPVIVGYIPRYLNRDFHVFLKEPLRNTRVVVERVNSEAPMQLRLLCSITASWPEGFKPCSDPDYTPLAPLDNGSKEECNLQLSKNRPDLRL
ncbi:MAG: HIRAN domain-containing protein [Thermodesulfobacteriota bacterium]|jgi:hypothetical protein